MAELAILTPYRRTRLRCDISSPAKIAQERSVTRARKGMASAGLSRRFKLVPTSAPIEAAKDVEQLASGAIRITPYHADLNKPHEQKPSTVGNGMLQLADMNVAPFITTRNVFRKPDMPGITPLSGDVQDSGDVFFQKAPAAGDDWTGHDLAADRAAYGDPQGRNFAIERHAVSKANISANTEVAVRFMLPGTQVHVPHVVKIFYFGGKVDQAGHGAYAVVFTADGIAFLHDRVNASENTDTSTIPNSVIVDRWRYAPQHRTAALSVFMRIIPHLDMNGGGYIEFVQDVQNPQGSNNVVGVLARLATNMAAYHVFRIVSESFVLLSDPKKVVSGPAPSGATLQRVARDSIAGASVVRLDAPCDQRVSWQILKAAYPTTAYFYDSYIDIPFCNTGSQIILTWEGVYPNSSCTITPNLYDGNTGLALTQTGSGTGWATFQPSDKVFHYIPYFAFAGDGKSTPTLWSYTVKQVGYTGEDTPGEFVIPDDYTFAAVRQVSITGPEADMTHETAHTLFSDPGAELNDMDARQIIQAQIETLYDPYDDTKYSTLFRGEMTKIEATLKGAYRPGGASYPSQAWKDFEATWSGMWARLARARTIDRIVLTGDTSADGKPFKVTDKVRDLLEGEFGSDLVDVPDNPVRFFPSAGGSESLIVDPGSEIMGTVTKWLAEYLGWYMIWDANAGTAGKLRVMAPSFPVGGTYRSLGTYTLDAPGTGRVTTRPESYRVGQLNWVGTDSAPPIAPIITGTWKSWVKPMEANCVIVTATGQIMDNSNGTMHLTQWARNSKSYNCFTDAGGMVISTQEVGPDYLGYMWPLIWPRFDLTTQDAVDRVTRRLYDQCCHATRMATFKAPLALVTDSADTLQTRPRPHRYYDCVTIVHNGVSTQWLVRNVNIEYKKDAVQIAAIEVQKPVLTGTVGQ